MDLRDKIVPMSQLAGWRGQIRALRRRLAVTNGCFDILHVGHVTYLEAARAAGDILLVGVNGDASVRALKGPTRPINQEADRAIVLAALRSVDAVCIFPEVQATEFLRLAQPDIYVKGGDYTLATLNAEERAAVENSGGRIVLIPFVPDKSTSALLAKMATR